MPGLSIHVVDVSRGVVANGMAVAVSVEAPGAALPALLISGVIASDGSLHHPMLTQRLIPGLYSVSFSIGAYYRSIGVKLPEPPFLDIAVYAFGLADPLAHYHLPFKCTPWGYSCFRGGA